jgi:hypothetical protein
MIGPVLTHLARVTLLILSSTVLMAPPLAAQTANFINPPEVACVDLEFQVSWAGPDAAGDKIVISDIDDPSNEYHRSTLTAEGSPLTIQAPSAGGEYRLRYVTNADATILANRKLYVAPCAASQGVRFGIVQTDYGEKYENEQLPGMPSQQELGEAYDAFCAGGGPEQLQSLFQQMQQQLDQSGAVGMGTQILGGGPMASWALNEALSTAEQGAGAVLDGLEEACADEPNPKDKKTFGNITYSHCRMLMDMAATNELLDIKIPEGGGDGTMLAVSGGEAVSVNLTARLEELASNQTGIGMGWSSGVAWSGGGQSSNDIIGYPTVPWTYEYTMGGGTGAGSSLALSQSADQGNLSAQQYIQQGGGTPAGASPLSMISGMVSVTNQGSGDFSTAVPGIDIVQSFYTNFANRVAPQGNLGSMFGGMIMNMVALLEKGIPLRMTSTVSSKILGATQVSGQSDHRVYSVELVELPPEWCVLDFTPEGVEVQDIDAQIEQAMAGAGAGSGQQDMQQMNEAMQQMNEAMQSLTPQQQQMMAQMGLSNMVGAGAPGMAAGAAAAAPAARATPSSADLTTADLTQTAQLHLEALGYDVGNTSGDLDTNTIIAISQFQAEKGMTVTGEVSPQLVGILSAEVDSRR